LQKKQRHECNIQQRTWAWPYLFGVDFERGLPEADRSESHHHAAQHDQQQAGGVSDDLTARRQGSRGEGRGRDPEEHIELLDQKAKRHDDDRSAHPGKKRPLIRRVVANTARSSGDAPKGCRSERRAEEQSEFRHNGSKRNCHRNPDLAVNAANLHPADRRKPRKCSPSENAVEAITAKNSQP